MTPTKINGFAVTLRTKNINGKILGKRIHTFVDLRLQSLPTAVGPFVKEEVWASIARLMESYLDDLREEQKIESYQVICDKRNNSQSFLNGGGYFALTIRYKHAQCLNLTELHYEMIKIDNNKTQKR